MLSQTCHACSIVSKSQSPPLYMAEFHALVTSTTPGTIDEALTIARQWNLTQQSAALPSVAMLLKDASPFCQHAAAAAIADMADAGGAALRMSIAVEAQQGLIALLKCETATTEVKCEVLGVIASLAADPGSRRAIVKAGDVTVLCQALAGDGPGDGKVHAAHALCNIAQEQHTRWYQPLV